MNPFTKVPITGTVNADISEKLALNAHILLRARNDLVAANQEALIEMCLEAQDDATLLHALQETKSVEAFDCLAHDIEFCCDKVRFQERNGTAWLTTLLVFPVELRFEHQNWAGPLVLPDPNILLEPLSDKDIVTKGETFQFAPRLFALDELQGLPFSEVYAATRWLAPEIARKTHVARPAFLTAPPLEETTDTDGFTVIHTYLLGAFTRPFDSTSGVENTETIAEWLLEAAERWSQQLPASVQILNPVMFHYGVFMAANYRRSERESIELMLAVGGMRTPFEDIAILASIHVLENRQLEARLAAYQKGNAQPIYTKT